MNPPLLIFWATAFFIIAFRGVAADANDPRLTEPNPVPIPAAPLDLQTCYELAVLRSETLGLREEDIRVAQARYWQAIGAVLPHIHLIATESLQNNAGGFNTDTGSGSFGGFSGSKDHFQSRINVTQPIFSGFRDAATTAANKAQIKTRQFDKQRAFQLLYLDVSDVFYQILMYQHDLQLLGDTRRALEQRISEIEKRLQLGKARSGDLLSSQSQLADLMVTVEQIQGALGASTEVMNFLTGLSARTYRLQDHQDFPRADQLEAYLTQTQERPDILAAIQSEKAATKNLSATKGQHWPTISAEGNYYLKEHPQSGRDWNILLTFDLPIFEGGAIEARVREQKALVRASHLNLEQIRRTADKDIRVAYNDFISSVAQVTHLEQAKAVAEANYRIQSEDYRRGVSSNLDALQALTEMYDMRRRAADAEMQARANLIRLHITAGEIRP